MMEWNGTKQLTDKPVRSPWVKRFVVGIQAGATFLARHWLFFVNGFWALLLIGAVIAPVAMALGLEGTGKVLYTVYSFTCHQLPERSFFLFGADQWFTTYNQAEVVAAGADPTSLLTLRQYVGTPEIGWKLAFSDRMVTMYGGAFLAGIIYWLLARRGRVRPIPVWVLLLLVLPMALDGTSHLLSELTGLGFRDSNAWAVPFFGAQPASFYTGTALGSLNSILRLVTGLLFGMGMMLFAYPLIGYSFEELAAEAERTLKRNREKLYGSPDVAPTAGDALSYPTRGADQQR